MKGSPLKQQRLAIDGTPPREILLFCGSLTPRIGGYEVHVSQTIQGILDRGASVTVITPASDGEGSHGASPQSSNHGLSVQRYPARWIGNGTLGVPKLGTILELLSIRAGQNAAVITETRFFPASWLGWFIAIVRGLPLIHVEHGGTHPVTGNRLIDALARLVDHLAGRFLSVRAGRVVAVSNESRNFLRHISVPSSKIKVIPDGLERPDKIQQVRGNDERRVPARRPLVIGFVGRLVFGKGVDTLLRAYHGIAKKFDNVELWIVGDGPERTQLEELSRSRGIPRVVFAGEVPHGEMITYYDQFDIVVSPSLSEGFGLVLLEAAQHGCAIIASDLPAFSEILVREIDFLPIRPGDVDHLAGRLREVLSNEHKRRGLGEAARSRVLAWPDWEDTTDALWEQVCLATQQGSYP